jgi:hypothetical protein
MKSAAFAAPLWFAMPAAGQPSAASVGGIVTDQSAARLSDATVTIRIHSPSSGESRCL